MSPGNRLEEWLTWFAHSFGGVECRGGMHSILILVLAPQKWQLGFWSFYISLFIICQNCTCEQLFLVLYSGCVFCCWSRCLSRCKLCNEGSQILACLMWAGPGDLLLMNKMWLSDEKSFPSLSDQNYDCVLLTLQQALSWLPVGSLYEASSMERST